MVVRTVELLEFEIVGKGELVSVCEGVSTVVVFEDKGGDTLVMEIIELFVVCVVGAVDLKLLVELIGTVGKLVGVIVVELLIGVKIVVTMQLQADRESAQVCMKCQISYQDHLFLKAQPLLAQSRRLEGTIQIGADNPLHKPP